jgi:hypothetical protein
MSTDPDLIEGEVLPSPPATAMTAYAPSPLDLPTAHFQAGLNRRQENRQALIAWIRQALVDGIDFGSIPTKRGPSKPSLWKPGAEKITGMLGLMVTFPSLKDTEAAILNGVKPETIVIRCELKDATGRVLADGAGARSLKQDYGDVNKAIKMAEKSAHIDAVLRLAGLSEVFTQDLEDLMTSKDEVPQPDDLNPSPERKISALEAQRLTKRIQQLQLQPPRVQSWIRRKWGHSHYSELTAEQFSVLWQNLDAWARAVQEVPAAQASRS